MKTGNRIDAYKGFSHITRIRQELQEQDSGKNLRIKESGKNYKKKESGKNLRIKESDKNYKKKESDKNLRTQESWLARLFLTCQPRFGLHGSCQKVKI
jgi:hypothetical protein